MDLVLIALIALYGFMRVSKAGQIAGNSTGTFAVMNDSGVNVNSIPVGNNLELQKELGAFTKIIKELGLI